MTTTPKDDLPEARILPDEDKYWWADDEEGPYHGPFDTEDECYSDAYCSRARCFDDPAHQDGVNILYGKRYNNPDYDSEYPYDGHENCAFYITGKPKYVEALDVTDRFHDLWVKSRTPAIADGVGVEELFQRFMNVLEEDTDIPNLYAVNAARLLAQHIASTPPQAATDEGVGDER